jgi:hypothetical protein
MEGKTHGSIPLTYEEAESLRQLAALEGTTVADLLRRLGVAEALRRGLYPPLQKHAPLSRQAEQKEAGCDN